MTQGVKKMEESKGSKLKARACRKIEQVEDLHESKAWSCQRNTYVEVSLLSKKCVSWRKGLVIETPLLGDGIRREKGVVETFIRHKCSGARMFADASKGRLERMGEINAQLTI